MKLGHIRFLVQPDITLTIDMVIGTEPEMFEKHSKQFQEFISNIGAKSAEFVRECSDTDKTTGKTVLDLEKLTISANAMTLKLADLYGVDFKVIDHYLSEAVCEYRSYYSLINHINYNYTNNRNMFHESQLYFLTAEIVYIILEMLQYRHDVFGLKNLPEIPCVVTFQRPKELVNVTKQNPQPVVNVDVNVN